MDRTYEIGVIHLNYLDLIFLFNFKTLTSDMFSSLTEFI